MYATAKEHLPPPPPPPPPPPKKKTKKTLYQRVLIPIIRRFSVVIHTTLISCATCCEVNAKGMTPLCIQPMFCTNISKFPTLLPFLMVPWLIMVDGRWLLNHFPPWVIAYNMDLHSTWISVAASMTSYGFPFSWMRQLKFFRWWPE